MLKRQVGVISIRKGDTIRKEYYNGVTNTKEAIEYEARFDQDDKHSWVGTFWLMHREPQAPTVPGVYVTDGGEPYRLHKDGHWSYGAHEVRKRELVELLDHTLTRVYTDARQEAVPF